MKVDLTLIGGLLAAGVFFIFLFEIALVMDMAAQVYSK